MVKKKTVISIFGGSGFLGKHICEHAIRNNYITNSISRTIPKQLEAKLSTDVNWISADILKEINDVNEQKLHDVLKESDVVVHSIGAMFNNPEYKDILKGGSGGTGIARFLLDGLLKHTSNYQENSYLDRINHLSAVKLAERFIDVNSKRKHLKFVYISADKGNCLMPNEEYLKSKRNAEYDLLELSNYYGPDKFSNLILRPGIMFDGCGRESTVRQKLIQNNKWIFTNTISVQQVSKKLFELLETTKNKNAIISLDELRS